MSRKEHPPSMDSLLARDGVREALSLYGREALKEEIRNAIGEGETQGEALLARARDLLEHRFPPTLARAINATGVLLHTNLGRAPTPAAAREALESVSAGYTTLEFDRRTGGRGRRQDHVRAAARDLFGCEDALAVNNNAAAIFLALSALARGRRVPVSRGELVAIGGSFRIPEILEASGAEMAEVGTTNRTTIQDYRKALSSGPAALLLTVHPSNYEIRGYTERPGPREIAALAREAGIPWVHDQGTGCVAPLDEFGVPGEPTVASCLADGADLVTFSADKLFGGPQAGFVVGRGELVSRLASHPVARVVRPGKLTLAALAATLSAWKREKWREFPVYRAAAASLEELRRRAESIGASLAASAPGIRLEVVPSFALFGGGTSPEKKFSSLALALTHSDFADEALLARLREAQPAIVARIEGDRVLLDMRSILPEEDSVVAAALVRCCR